ncbi:hypothetical protein BJD99_00895 [Rhodococcus sp. 1163]|uniref:DUF6412 domain-containing protein n=1 Tax=unclassified Rhodococcus (in: high G+C Gram-positive bacteria) TaxID=192944 RepID=UPI000A00C08E|nr:DUF6412 domain-containing protein [Rhodococcus sp. 1163]ORI11733.1 hypothetical protein BJD99_00895 [Rhodococcus sp. 1163]
MKFLHLVATYLVLLVVLATFQDSVFAAAFGLVLAAVVVTVVVISGRRGLILLLPRTDHGPDHEQRRLRGSFRRQYRPDEPGRPMPRAPGSVVGAL